MKKIGILYICIGRYRVFWDNFHKHVEEFLFANDTDSDEAYEKHYYIFTDKPDSIVPSKRVHTFRIQKEPWPYPTLRRWHYFLQAADHWQEMDYVYFWNANFLITGHIGKDLLPVAGKELVFTIHPGFPPGNVEHYTYERNQKSLAYVPFGVGEYYFMGSLNGGTSSAYKELCEELCRRTDEDLTKNIVAVWHDESHLNRYAIDYHEKITGLPHSTLTIEKTGNTSTDQASRILIQDKYRPQWGGHAWLRGQVPDQITVKLKGGLGNQLWQYAAAIALHTSCMQSGEKVRLCVDTSWYKRGKRELHLKSLIPNLDICEPAEYKRLTAYPTYREREEFTYDQDLLQLPPAVVLNGYFQHYQYFELAKPSLKLTLHPLPEELANITQNYELVAVHVRRGDYTSEKLQAIHGLLPLAYYQHAIDTISAEIEHPYFCIFSDDLNWAKEHLDLKGLAYQFMESEGHDADIRDFSIMAQCRHFIIANSSFSALAALWGSQEASKVYTPVLWHKSLNIKSSALLPSTWQPLAYPFYTEQPPEKPAVSIIVPVYNVADYLYRCLETVCLQTEKNIEIIIIDDASTDNSREIIQNFAARDTRIAIIYHETNRHLGGARNSGIEAARSEWLIFLDSDDYIVLDTVESFLKKTKKYHGVELFFCGIKQVHNGRLYDLSMPSVDTLIKDVFTYYCIPQKFELYHCAWAKMWKRDLFMRTNLRFPEGRSIEDLSLVPQLFYELNGPALFIFKYLFCYQFNPGGITNTHNLQQYGDFIKSVHDLQDWRRCLPSADQNMIKKRIFNEFYVWFLKSGMPDSYYNFLLKNASPGMIVQSIQRMKADLEQKQLQLNMLKKYKIVRIMQSTVRILKPISKKLGLYKMLKPLAKRLFSQR